METLTTGGAGDPAVAAFSSVASSSSSSSSSSASAMVPGVAPSSTAGVPPSSPISSCSDGHISSQNVALARHASTLFQSGQYSECLEVAHQLLLNEPENPKVMHNIAMAKFFQDGCSDLQNLLDELQRIKRTAEWISKGMAEHLDSAGASSSNGTQAADPPSSPDAYREEYDTSTVIFNIAVILFRSHQFVEALSVLEPLYQNIEPIDQPAALHICLLMLDITIASWQLKKASDVLQYMERVFCLGFLAVPSETGNNALCQSPRASSTTNSPMLSSPGRGASMEAVPSLSEDVLDDDILSLGLDMEGSSAIRSAPSSSMLSSAEPATIARQDPNVKVLLHLNRVRLYLCTRNLRAAKREIKLAMNLAQGADLSNALMLKAQLEYSRGNHQKAVKLLKACSSKEPGLTRIISNNMGCIQYGLRKDSVAHMYFLQALQCGNSPKVSAFAEENSPSILYNFGLKHLRGGKPLLAAQCFQEAGRWYSGRPAFWVRLAECCILALEKGLLKLSEYDNSINRDELRVSLVGVGKWRKLLLPSGCVNPSPPTNSNIGSGPDEEASSSRVSSDAPDFFIPGNPRKLSLTFARQCLNNARHLLNRGMVKAGKEGIVGHDARGSQPSANGLNKDGKVSSVHTMLTSLTTFEEEQVKETAVVMQHVLADLSYVELGLDNAVGALKSSQELLRQPECAKPFRFLGRVYAAEALCLLNRPSQAAQELTTCMLETDGLETPAHGADEGGHKWKSGDNSEASAEGDEAGGVNASSITEALSASRLTGTHARASLLVNLSMLHVMLGDVSQAHHFALKAVSMTPENPLAILSMVHVSLLQGRTQEAVSLLKHCRHICAGPR